MMRFTDSVAHYVVSSLYFLIDLSVLGANWNLITVVHELGRPAGWVGLGWIRLGWVEILQFSMGWVGSNMIKVLYFWMITQHTVAACKLSCSAVVEKFTY